MVKILLTIWDAFISLGLLEFNYNFVDTWIDRGDLRILHVFKDNLCMKFGKRREDLKEKEKRTKKSEYLFKRKYHGRLLGFLKLKLKTKIKAWKSTWNYVDKRGIFVPNN